MKKLKILVVGYSRVRAQEPRTQNNVFEKESAFKIVGVFENNSRLRSFERKRTIYFHSSMKSVLIIKHFGVEG